ncbi:MAG: Mov34/MPN/PAD-1 family protein [Clostridia bacterium]|nr:Mov34/MPN/PAD-1 family protein [Clostridia bacterium]
MRVVFSERAFIELLAETYEKISTETGGVFLGYYENETWYIVECLDPGPKSIFEVAYFEYDEKYVQHLINKVARIYKRNLSLLGLWHRHPGSFDVFSTTDDGTNSKYAQLAPQGAISALVNIDPKFRLTMYHVSNPLRYRKIQYEVNDAMFPRDILCLHNIDDYISFINNNDKEIFKRVNVKPSITFNEIISRVCKTIGEFSGEKYEGEILQAVKDEDYYDIISDVTFDDLEFLANDVRLNLNMQKEYNFICLLDKDDNEAKIYFSYIRSLKQCVFIYQNNCYKYRKGLIKDILSEPPKKAKGFLNNIRKFFIGEDESNE